MHSCFPVTSFLSTTTHPTTPPPRVNGLCEGNSPVTGEFPAQRTSNAENVSIWWRHHVLIIPTFTHMRHLLDSNISYGMPQHIEVKIKMVTILQTTFSMTMAMFNDSCWILIQISLNYISKGSTNNNPAVVKIMAWCRQAIISTNDGPLYWRIYAPLGCNELLRNSVWIERIFYL